MGSRCCQYEGDERCADGAGDHFVAELLSVVDALDGAKGEDRADEGRSQRQDHENQSHPSSLPPQAGQNRAPSAVTAAPQCGQVFAFVSAAGACGASGASGAGSVVSGASSGAGSVSTGAAGCVGCVSGGWTGAGITGGTGCGKSSLVNLIPRLYDATQGQVLIDGVDVRKYDLTALREMIGVVLQKNVLFSGTIKENIRWGKKDATDEEIVAACQAAQAHDFVLAQPKGYDTDLSQGGLNLSGGQKQRLCIARAMIKHPKILILDDSTSAVDTATEAKIRESFYKDFKDTTVFIIAQRVSSVQAADQILVLDDGQIKGIGTHEQLLADNEIYKEIVTTQAKGVSE